jgi:hypothetical protein
MHRRYLPAHGWYVAPWLQQAGEVMLLSFRAHLPAQARKATLLRSDSRERRCWSFVVHIGSTEVESIVRDE